MWLGLATITVAILISRILHQYLKHLRDVCHMPGLRPPFDPLGLPGAMIPTTWWNPGLNWNWEWRHRVYRQYQSETISLVPWLTGRPYIWTTSMEVIKQITNSRAPFGKARDDDNIVMLFGPNVVTADGEVYKRQRRVTSEAFNGKTHELVCKESGKVYHQMIDVEGWHAASSFRVESIHRVTSMFAMLVISRCGFGLPATWDGRDKDNAEILAIRRSLEIIVSNAALWQILPRWCFSLPISSLKRVKMAHNELPKQMASLVKDRRAELSTLPEHKQRHDVLSSMLKQDLENSKWALSDQEVMANTYVYMLAGHETTAQVLVAAFALIALHPDAQEEAYAHIKDVIADRDPVFSDIARLDKVAAIFHEAARMFPPAFFIIRDATAPFTLQLPDGHSLPSLSFPAGQRVLVDMIGLHYNPRIFHEPETFKPSRWYGRERDSDLSFFGFGTRICVGRKFALTEAVVLLSYFIRDWKVHPTLGSGESMEQWRSRVMQGRFLGLTFGIPNVPLTFSRRKC